jgi:predicted AAA+ superfamily ATPase
LEILNARADLSRRAAIYEMQGLSFREYLGMYHKVDLPIVTLDDIFQNHAEISVAVLTKVKPLQYFEDYLKHGYYPFYGESATRYYPAIEEVINMILEIELPLLRAVEAVYVQKVKQLLQIVASSAPFVPNVTKLAERMGISRHTLILYLFRLNEVRLVNSLFKEGNGLGKLQKPDKLYLENTNIAYALASGNTETGNMRETFFVNQLSGSHRVNYAAQGDFLINGKYTVEVGGQSKGTKQIEGVSNAFIAADNIEYGAYNKIPLWMFGLLY